MSDWGRSSRDTGRNAIYVELREYVHTSTIAVIWGVFCLAIGHLVTQPIGSCMLHGKVVNVLNLGSQIKSTG